MALPLCTRSAGRGKRTAAGNSRDGHDQCGMWMCRHDPCYKQLLQLSQCYKLTFRSNSSLMSLPRNLQADKFTGTIFTPPTSGDNYGQNCAYYTRDFTVVFHCNYTSILNHLWDISTYFPKILRGRITPNAPKYCRILRVLITINLHTRFEMSIFICSKGMTKMISPKSRNGSRDLTMPTWGAVSHQKVHTSPDQFGYKIWSR